MGVVLVRRRNPWHCNIRWWKLNTNQAVIKKLSEVKTNTHIMYKDKANEHSKNKRKRRAFNDTQAHEYLQSCKPSELWAERFQPPSSELQTAVQRFVFLITRHLLPKNVPDSSKEFSFGGGKTKSFPLNSSVAGYGPEKRGRPLNHRKSSWLPLRLR